MTHKMTFEGIEYTFYQQNLYNDNLVLISFKSVTVKTGEAKRYIDTFISAISDLVEIGAIVDERLEIGDIVIFSWLVGALLIVTRRNAEKARRTYYEIS